jgi:hypothetical protein
VSKYLKCDGVFILWLIAQHSDAIFITDLIYAMWTTHYRIERQRQYESCSILPIISTIIRALKLSEPKWNEHLKKRGLDLTNRNETLTRDKRHSFASPTKGTLTRALSEQSLTSSDEYQDTFHVQVQKYDY